MQTTRRASLSGAADERGTSEKASATQQPSGAADERGTSEKASETQQPSGAADERGTSEKASEKGGYRRRHLAMLLAVAVVVLALDVISKLIVVAKLSDRDPVRLLGGFLKLEETRNAGAAFSVGTGATVVFALVAVAVIVVILRTARRLCSGPWAVVLGLLLGGATGNLIDRIVRSPGLFRGQVVDWIALPHFAVFNLADSAITVGGVLAVLLAVAGRQIDGTVVSFNAARQRAAGRTEAPTEAPTQAPTQAPTDPPSDHSSSDRFVR